MNRGLVIFASALILIGILSNAYPVSVVGFVLLFPAVLAPSPKPRTPQPVSVSRQHPRVVPRQPLDLGKPSIPEASPPAAPVMPPAPFEQQSSYTSALFPTAMFPTFANRQSEPNPALTAQKVRSDEKDELVEMGAILALLKLAFG